MTVGKRQRGLVRLSSLAAAVGPLGAAHLPPVRPLLPTRRLHGGCSILLSLINKTEVPVSPGAAVPSVRMGSGREPTRHHNSKKSVVSRLKVRIGYTEAPVSSAAGAAGGGRGWTLLTAQGALSVRLASAARHSPSP